MPEKKKEKDFSLIFFMITIVVAIFLLGGFLATKGIHPFKLLEKGFQDTKVLVEEKTRNFPVLLRKKFYKGEDVTIHEKDEVYVGVTAMQGWFTEGSQIRLIDMDGKLINRWNIDFDDIWPDPKHVYPKANIPKTPYNFHSQGMELLSDGSAVLNIGNLGSVKLDRCSNVVWRVDKMTHHAVSKTKDGGFWIPANRDLREVSEDLIFSRSSFKKIPKENKNRYENTIIYVDKTGAVKKEFSVLRALVDLKLERQLYDALKIRAGDPTHVNDIEIVTQPLADKIDGVNPGDLLVSIRQLHMVAILDVEHGNIKWHHTGPWVRQHDPDITSEGNIVVFNNRYSPFFFQEPYGSNLIELDPATGQTRVIYPTLGQKKFYTDIQGTHQALPNGNRLITESRRGRVFEINAKGETVWEYIKSYDEERSALISESARFDVDYFTVTDWSCP